MRILLWVVLVLMIATNSMAQDFQLRIPTHIQPQADGSGVVVWGIFPNTMAKDNGLATLLVSGIVWKDKAEWLEVMLGTHRSEAGFLDPVLNIRFQENPTARLGISGEIQQSFRPAKRRTLWWFVFDTPTPLIKARVGVEIENINFWNGSASYGLGPRVAIPIPIKLPLGGMITVAGTHQFKTGRDFTRMYIITNFKY